MASPTAAQLETASPFPMHDNPAPVPDLQFVDDEGRETGLASFGNRAVLLNIWATWCVPCREEMPALDRLQARLGGPDFEVVPLSINRGGIPTIEAFYQELGLTALPIYVDASGSAGQRLRAIGIPTTLLINNEGEEIGRLVGPAEWDSPEMIALLQRHIQPTTAAKAEQRSLQFRNRRTQDENEH